MTTYTYRGITINITDDIEITDKLKKDIEDEIDFRLNKTLVLSKDPKRTDGKIHMEFALKGEDNKYKGKVPYYDVALFDCKGRIWLLYGLKPEDVTESDIEMAKHYWCDDVWVTKTDYDMIDISI